MAVGQTAGCPRVNRAKKFMCSPRNTGNINFSLWLTGGLSQGCPDFQKVHVFKVYVWEPPDQAQRSPGPFGPGTRKEEKSPKRAKRASRPGEPQSPQRVRHGVRKESKKAASDSFWTLFGLRGALFGDSGAPRAGRPFGLFRTLFGFRARRAWETSVPGRGVPKFMCLSLALSSGASPKFGPSFQQSGPPTPSQGPLRGLNFDDKSGKRKEHKDYNFLGPETTRWGGVVFHSKAPSKVCLPWVSKRGSKARKP